LLVQEVVVAVVVVFVEVVSVETNEVDETVVVEFVMSCPMLKMYCFWLFCSLSSAI
jgi:hypothetical protein